MASPTVPAAWLQDDAHDLAIIGVLHEAGIKVDFIRDKMVYVGGKPTSWLRWTVDGKTAVLNLEPIAPIKPVVETEKPVESEK